MLKQLKSLFVLYLFFVLALSLKECSHDKEPKNIPVDTKVALIDSRVGNSVTGDDASVSSYKSEGVILKDSSVVQSYARLALANEPLGCTIEV